MQKNLTMLVTLDSDGEEMDVQMIPAKPLDRELVPPDQVVKQEPLDNTDDAPSETLDGGVKDVDGSAAVGVNNTSQAAGSSTVDPETRNDSVADVDGSAVTEAAEASGGTASSADAATGAQTATETAEGDEENQSLGGSPSSLYNGLEQCGACGTCANCAAELGPN